MGSHQREALSRLSRLTTGVIVSRGTIARLAYRIDRLVEGVGNIFAWLVIALVALVAANVLARYLLSAGAVSLQELEWHLLAVLALIGISFGINRGEEVRVDMLYARLSPSAKQVVDAISAVLMTAVALIMMKLSFAYVGQSFALKEGSPDPGGLPSRFILKSFLPLGFALLAAQGVVQTAKAVTLYKAAIAARRGTTSTGTPHDQ